MSAQVRGTAEVYHAAAVGRRVNTKPLPTRKRLYFDLAYCRMRLGRLRGNPQWAEFYREECAKLERLLHGSGGIRPTPGAGDLTRQADSWLRLSSGRTLPVMDAAREAGPDKRVAEVYDGHCARCESWGHEVTRCPFDASDAEVIRVAELRRERRSRETAALLTARPVIDDRFASLYR